MQFWLIILMDGDIFRPIKSCIVLTSFILMRLPQEKNIFLRRILHWGGDILRQGSQWAKGMRVFECFVAGFM
jgi:hypothetical protein